MVSGGLELETVFIDAVFDVIDAFCSRLSSSSSLSDPSEQSEGVLLRPED